MKGNRKQNPKRVNNGQDKDLQHFETDSIEL